MKTTTTLKIQGFNATETINSSVVDLQLSDIKTEKHKTRNVYIVDNDQVPTAKGHPKQITDKYRHLKDIQIPQLNNLNVGALLICDMYALIIAREIREGNPDQPIALDGQSQYRIRILHQRTMSTFAKPVRKS